MAVSKNEVNFWSEKAEESRESILNMSQDMLIQTITKDILDREETLLLEFLKIKGKKIINIGCGSSIETVFWEKMGNMTYGLDVSRQQVLNAVSVHRKMGLNNRFLVASACNIPSKNNFFDLINMHWVIHHINEEFRNQMMEEANRVISTNGILLISERNYSYPFRRIVQTNKLKKFNVLRRIAINKGVLDPDEKGLTYKSLATLLEENGFRVIKTNYSHRLFWYLPALLFPRDPKGGLLQGFSKLDNIIIKLLPKNFANNICDNISIIAKKKT